MAPDLGLYVYGLIADGALAAAPELAGIDGEHTVELVTEGKLSALVSRVSLEQFDEQPLRDHLGDMAWVERTARGHQQVLDAVLDQTTPIPMRLCTLYNDEHGLRRMLELQQEDLSGALAELSGKLEWGVQVFAAPRALGEDDRGAPGRRSAASGTAYLQTQLSARHAAEHAHADLELACERLHAQLCSEALACRLGTPQRPELSGRETPMLLNAFYLVPNDRREQFCARVEQLAAEAGEQGLELQLTGPWAPYNFVTTEIGGPR